MTPLQKLEAAAEAYALAGEALLRMNRNNSTMKGRAAARKRHRDAQDAFSKLVTQQPGEVVKLFRSHRRLQQAIAQAISYPTESREDSLVVLKHSREILP